MGILKQQVGIIDSIGESVPKRCKVLLMYNNNRLSLQKNF